MGRYGKVPRPALLDILDWGITRVILSIVKTAISIPDPLFRAADRLAKRLGIARSHLYSRAIERYVSEAQQRNVTALLNEVYEQETSELDSVLAALQSASIPRKQW